MAKRRNSNRRRRRGNFGFLYKLLSMLVVCAAIIAAITLFFKVETVEIAGQERYTAQQVKAVTGIEAGDNLILLNKYEIAAGIIDALPYVEEIRINRILPDTLRIEVRECETPLALVQDGSAWLISPKGKIVEQQKAAAAKNYASVSGCGLVEPAVGTQINFETEYSAKQSSLLTLLDALSEAGMLENLDGVRLDDLQVLHMDYAGRFTVELPYGADYPYKLRFLREVLSREEIQDNMTGTFNMTRDDGKVNFIQNVR